MNARLLPAVALLLAACGGTAPASAPPSSPSIPAATKPVPSGITLPTLPDPVPVTLDAATSAYLVLDFSSTLCPNSPDCTASLPAVSALLKKAHNARVPVFYTLSSQAGSTVVPEVAPQPGDTVLQQNGGGPDKFKNTNVGDQLKGKGAKFVVISGNSGNGAAMYTVTGAMNAGYQAVIPVDTMPTAGPFEKFYAEYQMLHLPTNSNNTENKPLGGPTTLSRSDLISFK
jgi:nicotinamidase-related amidase